MARCLPFPLKCLKWDSNNPKFGKSLLLQIYNLEQSIAEEKSDSVSLDSAIARDLGNFAEARKNYKHWESCVTEGSQYLRDLTTYLEQTKRDLMSQGILLCEHGIACKNADDVRAFHAMLNLTGQWGKRVCIDTNCRNRVEVEQEAASRGIPVYYIPPKCLKLDPNDPRFKFAKSLLLQIYNLLHTLDEEASDSASLDSAIERNQTNLVEARNNYTRWESNVTEGDQYLSYLTTCLEKTESDLMWQDRLKIGLRSYARGCGRGMVCDNVDDVKAFRAMLRLTGQGGKCVCINTNCPNRVEVEEEATRHGIPVYSFTEAPMDDADIAEMEAAMEAANRKQREDRRATERDHWSNSKD